MKGERKKPHERIKNECKKSQGPAQKEQEKPEKKFCHTILLHVLRRLEQKVPANEYSAPMKQPILDMLRERTRMSFPVEEPEATLESLLAACGLLLELASADGTFSDDERKRILAILRDEYQMCVGDAEELMNLAEQVLRDAEDDSEFTRIINDHYSV